MKYLLILSVASILIACSSKNKTAQPAMEKPSSHSINSGALAVPDLSMFPKAENGYKMVVISVPAMPNEQDLKVEVFVGKTMEVDCNYYFMMGQAESKTLDGWGYTYTHIITDGGIAGTKMGCPDNSQKEAFVHMAPLLLNYNSRFPEIIYVPDFCEVKYRVWSAHKEWNMVETYPLSAEGKPLIRDCPDEKIINAMPSVGEGGPPKIYYIYKGARKELTDFDEQWVQKNCKVRTTTAH